MYGFNFSNLLLSLVNQSQNVSVNTEAHKHCAYVYVCVNQESVCVIAVFVSAFGHVFNCGVHGCLE